jgi:hypothetical protein
MAQAATNTARATTTNTMFVRLNMTDSYDVLSPEESVSLRGMIELGDFKIDADERTATCARIT